MAGHRPAYNAVVIFQTHYPHRKPPGPPHRTSPSRRAYLLVQSRGWGPPRRSLLRPTTFPLAAWSGNSTPRAPPGNGYIPPLVSVAMEGYPHPLHTAGNREKHRKLLVPRKPLYTVHY